ncbi:MAG TPA: protein kinase, partial [Pyrinomonadaceae bacterium]|nr:protein kinase [Pyrinomonadaceae bacterium]
MIGRTISHYRILSKLGQGAMSVVYIAEDLQLGREVAFKVLTDRPDYPQLRARMLREARTLSSVSHPRIATVYEYGETPEGQPYIAMELVRGRTLSELLSGSNNLTLDSLLEIVEGVAEGLVEAHRLKIVHRDIKPSNVAITERGDVKILDFGLAKRFEVEDGTSEGKSRVQTSPVTQTREGIIVGTPMYSSPEQTLGADVDGRSDIFSLGALLYECIAGRVPFEGKNNGAISTKVVFNDPPPPSKFNPSVPPELDRITLKALSKKPEERYQSARKFLADLRRLRKSLPGRTRAHVIKREHAPAPSRQSPRLTAWSEALRRPRTLLAAFLATSAAALLLIWGSTLLHRAGPGVPAAAMEHYERGVNALRDGTLYTAIRELEKAIQLEEAFPLAHATLAEAWHELDNSTNSEKEIGRAQTLSARFSGLPDQESLQIQAITGLNTNNLASAIKNYETLVNVTPEGAKADAYVDLGRAYEKNEEIEKALDAFTKASNATPSRPSAFLRLGELYARKQNLASATEVFEKAEALYRAEKNYTGLSEVFYQRGSLYNRLKMSDEARSSLQLALDTAKGAGDIHQQIKALLELCVTSSNEGDGVRARQYAADALTLAQNSSLDVFVTQVHFELGNSYLLSRDLGQAEEHFQQALYWSQKHGGRRHLAMASFRLASLYEQQAKGEEVLRYIKPALDFFKQGGYSKEYLDSLRLSGRAHLQKGDFARATQAFDEATQLARRTDNLSQVAGIHFEFGNLLSNREHYPAALGHFAESCALYGVKSSEHVWLSYSLLYRADVQWRIGLYADAAASLDQLSSVIKSLDDKNRKKLLARKELIESQLALSQLNFGEAIGKAREAIKTAQGGAAEYVFIEAHSALGLALARSGAKGWGLPECRKALELAEKEDEPRLRFAALLALAESKLAAGDSQGALQDALSAREHFAQGGQLESELRAVLIAAEAARKGGDSGATRSYLQNATEISSKLAEEW